MIPMLLEFQSTPSARRATACGKSPLPIESISIHALREESDLAVLALLCAGADISIHALREESDTRVACDLCGGSDFNPRPPRGERQEVLVQKLAAYEFQSTPSARRATFGPGYLSFGNYISIHALREESDKSPKQRPPLIRHFNPRPPRGERRLMIEPYSSSDIFQSTPSARRATRQETR